MDTPAGIYARISRARDGSTLGVDRQEPPCRELAARRGFHVVETYVDNDLSAYSGKPRPSYQRMLGDVEAGRIRAIVAWHADRLTRRVIEAEALIDLADRYGTLLATCTGEHDLATPAGRFQFRMLGVVARYESEHKAERLLLMHEELARAGADSGGGKRPFGFAPDRISIDPVEAAPLREAAHRLLGGDTLSGITRDWTARGIGAAQGGSWHPTTLRRVLLSGRVAGLREHNGQITGDAQWPAILEWTEWDRLGELLARNTIGRKKLGPGRRYLLTGNVGRCGLCNGPLGSNPEDGRRRYRCRRPPRGQGCGRIQIVADPLEDMVADAVIARLAGPGLVAARRAAAGTDAERAGLLAELEAAEATLRRLDDDLDDGVIDRPRWLRRTERVTERTGQIRAQLGRLPVMHALDDLPATEAALRAAWAVAGMERRRAIVEAMLEAVVIAPQEVQGVKE